MRESTRLNQGLWWHFRVERMRARDQLCTITDYEGSYIKKITNNEWDRKLGWVRDVL